MTQAMTDAERGLVERLNEAADGFESKYDIEMAGLCALLREAALALSASREEVGRLTRERDSRSVKVGEYYIGRHPAGGYWIEHESGEGMQGGERFEEAIHEYYKQNF